MKFLTFDEYNTKSNCIFFDRTQYDSLTFLYRKNGLIIGYICDISNIRDEYNTYHEYVVIILKYATKYFNDSKEENEISDYKKFTRLKEAEKELKNLYLQNQELCSI